LDSPIFTPLRTNDNSFTKVCQTLLFLFSSLFVKRRHSSPLPSDARRQVRERWVRPLRCVRGWGCCRELRCRGAPDDRCYRDHVQVGHAAGELRTGYDGEGFPQSLLASLESFGATEGAPHALRAGDSAHSMRIAEYLRRVVGRAEFPVVDVGLALSSWNLRPLTCLCMRSAAHRGGPSL